MKAVSEAAAAFLERVVVFRLKEHGDDVDVDVAERGDKARWPSTSPGATREGRGQGGACLQASCAFGKPCQIN